MSDKPDGGPAFPRPVSTDEHDSPCNVFYEQSGMTLRDYFAALAMAGNRPNPNGFGGYAERAMYAYKMADAMLAERDKS